MIPITLTKDQTATTWRTLKKMISEHEVKQNKEVLSIMDRFVQYHDIADDGIQKCNFLFSRLDAFLVWSILKVIIDDKIITDPEKTMDIIEILIKFAHGLDTE